MSEMVDQQNRNTTSFQVPVLCEKNTSAVQLANQNTRFIQVTMLFFSDCHFYSATRLTVATQQTFFTS